MQEKIWIWGKHTIESIVKNNTRKIFKILSIKQNFDWINSFNLHIPIELCERRDLDKSFGEHHQGICMLVSQVYFFSLKEWLALQNERSFLLACDLIEDPHNLGAVVRSCAAFGVDGLLVTKIKRAPFNGSLAKSAAGGLELVKIIEVANLANALRVLSDNGFFVLGLDENGSLTWPKAERSVLVLGQEGLGLRELTKKCCDVTIKIDTLSEFSTLNVSVAAGISIAKLLGK